MTATDSEPEHTYQMERYGPQWLVYRDGDFIPWTSFDRKRDAERWIRRAVRDDKAGRS